MRNVPDTKLTLNLTLHLQITSLQRTSVFSELGALFIFLATPVFVLRDLADNTTRVTQIRNHVSVRGEHACEKSRKINKHLKFATARLIPFDTHASFIVRRLPT